MGFGGISVWQLIILIAVFAPAIHVLVSERSHGGAKFGWFLAILFFSWVGYIVFLIVTQSTKDSLSRRRDQA
ncbi:PLDc N-terminal domain-containing protein [Marinobacterium litorale]|uniref:PLDc N-terminal domain-containing protein n=1 Tax=Marinobacterium litorale TaxID=404770 RepID=UPI00055B352D